MALAPDSVQPLIDTTDLNTAYVRLSSLYKRVTYKPGSSIAVRRSGSCVATDLTLEVIDVVSGRKSYTPFGKQFFSEFYYQEYRRQEENFRIFYSFMLPIEEVNNATDNDLLTRLMNAFLEMEQHDGRRKATARATPVGRYS